MSLTLILFFMRKEINVKLKYQLAVLLTMMSSLLMTASADEVSATCTTTTTLTLADLQPPPDGVVLPQCSGDVFSSLKFILNDQVVGEELLLSPPTYYVGDSLEVKLQEDLRVCNRYNTVALWIAIELPNGTRLV